MQALNDDQRTVMALVTIEGMSYQEAATVIDKPVGTVMSRLARARAALTMHLQTMRTPMASR
jgi:RNA polymerase sigma-70 factor (ECF subfamily)